MSDLWQRLKQRKLVQWALAYLAASWGVLQMLDLAANNYGWPTLVVRVAFGVIALGFVLTLLLAWYHGERGVQKVSGTELLLLALVCAVGGGMLWRYANNAPADETTATGGEVAVKAGAADASPAATIDAKSIAVLPFTNMSTDKDDAYFADGLSDEIINSLSRVPDLQVAARTSSFALRDSKDTVPEIARKLHVATVLEGSVRRAGKHLRMTAQLIRAADGFELWSDTYDRSSDDIIVIQEEVARAIAQALKTATDPKALADMQRAGTRVVPAYDAYLQGLALRIRAATSSDYRFSDDAMAAFDKAIALDPGFTDAYEQTVGLAQANIDLTSSKSPEVASTPYAQSVQDFRRRLELASQHARDPAQASLYRSMRAWVDLRFADALRLIRVYLAEHPENYDALQQAGNLAYILGDNALFREYAERMYALAQNPAAVGTGMSNMMWLPDRQRSVQMARDAVKRHPDAVNTAYQAQRVLLTAGLVKEAAALLPVMLSSDMAKPSKGLVQMRQACAEGRRHDAEAAFQSEVRGALDLSLVWHGLLLLGRDDDAAKLLTVYDQPQALFGLSIFLTYPKFDVHRYPALLSNLQVQGITPQPVRTEPYNCKPAAASP